MDLAVQLQLTVQLQLYRIIRGKKPTEASIIFEKNVMVMWLWAEILLVATDWKMLDVPVWWTQCKC